MPAFDLDAWVARSRAVDLSEIDWAKVARHPVPPETVRTLRFMQDIESHTIIYTRTLLATRAIDDPEVATFLACWLYEETFHGIAIRRFLEAAGHPVGERAQPRSTETPLQWLEARMTAVVSRLWPDFCAVHMTWGAINELSTLTAYRRLIALPGQHPILVDLLERIALDESRHFFFYFRQAERRMQSRAVARVARVLVDRFWAPVGARVQPDAELIFMARYLFGDAEGRAAARKVDETIRRLPGFAGAGLLEAWMERHAENGSDNGGRNGHSHY
ncbi:MAG TPA: ferritin-like domain-containing protein [Methylomirabilota bacterium]|jgi:hypothetical protein|nr:ferritin-like domain-containing protein [Methylomirabilota bacterium]